MGRKKDITEFCRGQITAYAKMNLSNAEIARRLNISRRSVKRHLDREASSNNRYLSGRKRCTTNREDRYIKSLVIRDPTKPSTNIAQAASELNISISPRTIRRRLTNDFNLPARRPSKKPLLTEKQRLARIKFCNIHKDKSPDWWENVMFTDESTFQQVRSCGYNYIRRPPNRRYDPKFTIKTVKHPPSIMCWGAITAKGRAGIAFLEKGKRLNSQGYMKILDEKVKVHMNIHEVTYFQQDSAPCHVSKVTKRWFVDNQVQLLENWPANSPDLNVIENCWSVMKSKVNLHCPSSESDLLRILKSVWTTEISPDYCRRLVRSMPSRIQAVLDNKGYPTKY